MTKYVRSQLIELASADRCEFWRNPDNYKKLKNDW